VAEWLGGGNADCNAASTSGLGSIRIMSVSGSVDAVLHMYLVRRDSRCMTARNSHTLIVIVIKEPWETRVPT
jgi:hypothetical protein